MKGGSREGRNIVCGLRFLLAVFALMFQPYLPEAGAHYGEGLGDQLEPECSRFFSPGQ